MGPQDEALLRTSLNKGTAGWNHVTLSTAEGSVID